MAVCNSCGLHFRHKENDYSCDGLDGYVTILCTITISITLNFGDL